MAGILSILPASRAVQSPPSLWSLPGTHPEVALAFLLSPFFVAVVQVTPLLVTLVFLSCLGMVKQNSLLFHVLLLCSFLFYVYPLDVCIYMFTGVSEIMHVSWLSRGGVRTILCFHHCLPQGLFYTDANASLQCPTSCLLFSFQEVPWLLAWRVWGTSRVSSPRPAPEWCSVVQGPCWGVEGERE